MRASNCPGSLKLVGKGRGSEPSLSLLPLIDQVSFANEAISELIRVVFYEKESRTERLILWIIRDLTYQFSISPSFLHIFLECRASENLEGKWKYRRLQFQIHIRKHAFNSQPPLISSRSVLHNLERSNQGSKSTQTPLSWVPEAEGRVAVGAKVGTIYRWYKYRPLNIFCEVIWNVYQGLRLIRSLSLTQPVPT